MHDAQYTEEEYPHKVGWGHSSIAHVAIFADKTKVERLLLHHHDPSHDDATLDTMVVRTRRLWGVEEARCAAAAEGAVLNL